MLGNQQGQSIEGGIADDHLDLVGSEQEEDEESQINRLLQETFTNNNYMDEELKTLLEQPPKGDPHPPPEDKSSKASSVIASEISEIQPYQEEHSMYKSDLSESEESVQSHLDAIPVPLTQLQVIENLQLSAFAPSGYEAVQKEYRMHLVNEEEKLRLTHNYEKGVPYYVNAHLNREKITVAGVEVYYESNTRTFIVWSTAGEIVIYLPSSDKRIQFKPFETSITSLSISSNMEMIAVASDNMEFAVYRLREAIRIQDNLSFRLLPKPSLFYKMDYRNLESNIIQIQFLEIANEVECIVLNQYDEIFTIKIQKKLLKYKAVTTPLPIAFTTVFMFKSFDLLFEHQKYTGLLISSGDAVTLAIIKPKFQLIFVREQTNRSSIIKQGRIPFIDYCDNKLMVVWDKFVDIIEIHVDGSYDKPEYNVHTYCHYFFAQNSLAVGFLSETLIYQFSRTGLRIYSMNRFNEGPYSANKETGMKQAEIYHEEIALDKIPEVGSLVGEILTNSQPPITQLRYFNKKICCTLSHTHPNLNNSLVFAYQNHALQSIQFLSYKAFVSKVIDSQGNWRLGLNTLKRVYEGNIYQLDCIRFNRISSPNNKYLRQFKSLCEDYVIRFVEKTKSIIQVDRGQNHWNTEDIQRQESLFICDFLIRTDKSEFLMDEVVIKMKPQINCLESLKPFILLKRLKTFGYQNISYYFNNLPDEFLSKLIYTLDIDRNQLNEIKSNAIRKKMYLEFIYLCTEENDFYTPFVILMAKYREDRDPQLILLLLYFLKKSISGEKLPVGNYSFQAHKQILKEIILKILTPEVYSELFKVAPLPLFQQVLPCFFLPQVLPPLNSLQSDPEIRQEFSKLKRENDIIKSLIIGNIPKQSAESDCKGPYWMFIIRTYARSLVVRMDITEGLYYLAINELIDNELVKEVIAKKETVKQFEEYRGIEDFIERLSSLRYTQLEILLLRMAGRYIDAIKLLLSEAYTENTVYAFLEDTIHSLSPKDLEELSLIVKDNIKFLAEKDISKLEWLLTTYYSKDQQVFLEVMKPYPELQLSLMSQFLKHKSSENHQLRVAYLQLLAHLGYKSRVQKQILTSLYPLDESLEICKRYDILKGEAYIYERIGDVMKAINTHFAIIRREIQFIDEKDWTDDLMAKTLYETMNESMKSCTKNCKKFTKRDDYDSEIFWMKIVEGFEGLKLKGTFHHYLISQVINERILPRLFQQIISNVELSSILRYVEENMKKLEFGTVRLLFTLLVKAYAYQNQMLHRCQSMVQEGVQDIRQTIIQHYKQGFVTDGFCSVCHHKEDLVIRYPCGHFIHPYCTTNLKICQVCSLEDSTFKFRQIISKQELKFDLIRMVRPDEGEGEVKVNRRQRLVEYEFENKVIDEFTRKEVIRRDKERKR